MVNGRISLPSQQNNPTAEVRRCMRVMSCDGTEVGFVAGVVVDAQSERVSHVLLGHLPVTADYRLIPIHLIDQVLAERIRLTIPDEAIDTLIVHQPDT